MEIHNNKQATMTDLDIEDAYNAGATVPELAMKTGRGFEDIRRLLAGI